MAIPYVGSIGAVVALTILPVAFSNTATATNAALTSDLLHSPAVRGPLLILAETWKARPASKICSASYIRRGGNS